MKGLSLIRCFSTTRKNLMQPSLVKLKKLQAEFQVDDGKLVWEKRPSDRVLYATTVALACLGLSMSFVVIYDLAKPTSWKEPTC